MNESYAAVDDPSQAQASDPAQFRPDNGFGTQQEGRNPRPGPQRPNWQASGNPAYQQAYQQGYQKGFDKARKRDRKNEPQANQQHETRHTRQNSPDSVIEQVRGLDGVKMIGIGCCLFAGAVVLHALLANQQAGFRANNWN